MPQEVSLAFRTSLHRSYTRDLELLLSALPLRFLPHIQYCLEHMSSVFSLPLVMVHRDFSTCNIMVDTTSCQLTGVIDWAEAGVCPFGQNLHFLQHFSGTMHISRGWRQFMDHAVLQKVFWQTFSSGVGGMTLEMAQAIQVSRVMGCLLVYGFTRRLANEPEVAPIRDDEFGRYNMRYLDAFLLDPTTRFEENEVTSRCNVEC